MVYVVTVRLTTLYAGAAAASFVGLYLYHRSISQQMKGFHESLEERIYALEKAKKIEASKPVEAME